MLKPTHILDLGHHSRWYLFLSSPHKFQFIGDSLVLEWKTQGPTLFEFYDKKYITEIKPLNLENV